MEFISAEFLSALLTIVIIDLVLAGDNAIVIGLAARNLPKEQQTKAIIFGTMGAIVIRIAATLAVVWILKIPGLLVGGGIVLVWIAYKLLTEDNGHDVKAGSSLWAAIKTIIIADAAMGLDNVLAIAGAAHGDFIIVVIGLLISVPIVVWGSTIILKWMERFPIIITIGAAVLAWTAAKMIVEEPFVHSFFTNDILKYGFEIFVIGAVLFATKMKKDKQKKVIEMNQSEKKLV